MLPASKELETANIRSSDRQTFTSCVGHTCVLCAQTYLRPAAEKVSPLPLGKVFRARTVQTKRAGGVLWGGQCPPAPLLPCGNLFDLQSLLRRSRREAGLFAWRREWP